MTDVSGEVVGTVGGAALAVSYTPAGRAWLDLRAADKSMSSLARSWARLASTVALVGAAVAAAFSDVYVAIVLGDGRTFTHTYLRPRPSSRTRRHRWRRDAAPAPARGGFRSCPLHTTADPRAPFAACLRLPSPVRSAFAH